MQALAPVENQVLQSCISWRKIERDLTSSGRGAADYRSPFQFDMEPVNIAEYW